MHIQNDITISPPNTAIILGLRSKFTFKTKRFTRSSILSLSLLHSCRSLCGVCAPRGLSKSGDENSGQLVLRPCSSETEHRLHFTYTNGTEVKKEHGELMRAAKEPDEYVAAHPTAGREEEASQLSE